MYRRYKTSSVERNPTWVRNLTPRGEILPPEDSKKSTSHEDLKNPISPESFQSWKQTYGRLKATTHTPTWVRKLTPEGEITPPADSKKPTSHGDLKKLTSPESFQSWQQTHERLQVATPPPPFQKVIQQYVHTTYDGEILPVQPPFECIRPSSDTDSCTHASRRKLGATTRSWSEPVTGAFNRRMRVVRRMLLPCIDTPPPIDTPPRRVSFSPTDRDAVYVERARPSLCLRDVPTVSILKR
jgi:hypothetical protein